MKPWIWMFVAVTAALGTCPGVAKAQDPSVIPTTSDDASAGTQDSGSAGLPVLEDGQFDPVWRVRSDLMWMRLSKLNDAALVTNWTPGGSTLLNASGFKFDYETGPEIAIWRQINDDWNVEGRFFRIDGWYSIHNGEITAYESDVQYAIPFKVGGPNYVVDVFETLTDGGYRSKLSNVEINGRRRINDFWSLLLGFRYLGLDENLDIAQGFGYFPNPNDQTKAVYAAFAHNISAVNSLYGFQVGADMDLWSRGRMSIEGLFKAGIYGDHATNSAHIGLIFARFPNVNTPIAESNTSADGVAFAGEMGITGVYRFTKHLSLRAGYQLLWLEGVAQASDQVAVLNPGSTSAVAFQGGPHYDGAFLGLELAR